MRLYLTTAQMVAGALVWEAVFLFLSATGFNPFQLLNLFGFLTLAFLPGLLTIALLRIEKPLPQMVVITVALSLLELMLMGLLGNTVLPWLGTSYPLSKYALLFEFAFLVNALAAFNLEYTPGLALHFKYFIFESVQDTIVALAPLGFVVMAVAGAIRLNNGGDGSITLLMLLLMALYAAYLFWRAPHVGDNVIPVALFWMALALLLMTSMRGWHITGHDIQREFKVFELTKSAGYWSMSLYQDAYNACLSITILPTIFANLLAVADEYVYKFFFQIFFALSVPLVYLISRTWLSRRLSFLAALYFIAFPTFFEDMPFLIRQEIAFLFFGLMVYLLFDDSLPRPMVRALFGAMALGAVLSHYSTTYTIIAVFGLLLLMRPWFIAAATRISALRLAAEHRLTWGMFGAVVAMSLVWTVGITNTGGNITEVLGKTVAAVQNGFTESSRSADARSLFNFGALSPQEEIAQYTVQAKSTRLASPGTYYAESAYPQGPYEPLQNEVLPLTPLGTALEGLHVPFDAFGGWLAKLVELSLLLGLVYALLRMSPFEAVGSDRYLFATASMLFIAVNVVVPVLSTEYGVFRVLQQSLFVLAPFIVCGTVLVGELLERGVRGVFANGARAAHLVGSAVPAAVAITFFLYATTAIPQLLGGGEPALHVNNSGFYYDNYYMQDAELSAIAMLNGDLQSDPGAQVQADRFPQNKIVSLANVQFSGDIFPGLIQKGAYVFLAADTVRQGRASVLLGGSTVAYRYPAGFLDATKDLIYDSGSARIYK